MHRVSPQEFVCSWLGMHSFFAQILIHFENSAHSRGDKHLLIPTILVFAQSSGEYPNLSCQNMLPLSHAITLEEAFCARPNICSDFRFVSERIQQPNDPMLCGSDVSSRRQFDLNRQRITRRVHSYRVHGLCFAWIFLLCQLYYSTLKGFCTKPLVGF